jgi:hypothetical protein
VNQWLERVEQWQTVFKANEEVDEDGEESEEEQQAGREMWETSMQTSSWWFDRMLNTMPVKVGSHLWFWNDGLHISACWDNRQQRIDALPAWSAQKGQIQLTHAQFLEEVRAFHNRFFAAMANRIQEVKDTYHPERTERAPEPIAFIAARAGLKKLYAPLPQKGADPHKRFWPHPDIAVNLARIEEEQQERFQWLASSLKRVSTGEAIDVDAVFSAMEQMDRFVGLPSV